MTLIEKLDQYLNSGETDPDKLMKKICHRTASSYKSKIRDSFSNDEFIQTVIAFNDEFANSDNKITRNSILSIQHIGFMYKFYPDEAFDFIWQYAEDKKLIPFVARNTCFYPQFTKQDNFKAFILKLPTTAPKKDTILLFDRILTVLMRDNPTAINDDKDFLEKCIMVFEDYIQKKPESYHSIEEFPQTIDKLKAMIVGL